MSVEEYYDRVRRHLEAQGIWRETVRKFPPGAIRTCIRRILERFEEADMDPEVFDWATEFEKLKDYDTIDDFIHELEEAGKIPRPPAEVSELEERLIEVRSQAEALKAALEEAGIDEEAEKAIEDLESLAERALHLEEALKKGAEERAELERKLRRLERRIAELRERATRAPTPPPPPPPPAEEFYHVTVEARSEPARLLTLIERYTGATYPSIESVLCRIFRFKPDDPEVRHLAERGVLEPSRITPADNDKLRRELMSYLRKLGVPTKSWARLVREALSRVSYSQPYDEIRRAAEMMLDSLAEEELRRLEAERIARRRVRVAAAPPPEEAAPPTRVSPAPPVGVSFPYAYYHNIHYLPDGMKTSYARQYLWNNPLFKRLMEGERLLLMIHPFVAGWMARLREASSPHYIFDRTTPPEILPWEWRMSADAIDRWIREDWKLSGGLAFLLKELVKEGKLSLDTFRAFKLEHLWEKYGLEDPR